MSISMASKFEMPCPTVHLFEGMFELANEFESLSLKSLKRQIPMVEIPSEQSAVREILRRVRKNEQTDLFVIINGEKACCHSIALKIYSKLLHDDSQKIIVCNTNEMTLESFKLNYNWMIDDDTHFQPQDLVPAFRAARFIGNTHLEKEIWQIFDGNDFNEINAFGVLLASVNSVNLLELYDFMSARITKSTLKIISTPEFLTLNESQICSFIKSSKLGVNSETELLFGSLMWLDHMWPQRISSVGTLLRHIRFGFIGPAMLRLINVENTEALSPYNHVWKVFYKIPENAKLVSNGIYYSGAALSSKGHDLDVMLQRLKFEVLVHRQWLCDTRCPYHVKVRTNAPNIRKLLFTDFGEYMKTLQESEFDPQYYQFANTAI